MTVGVISNPGTGSVFDSNKEEAAKNMVVFIRELNLPGDISFYPTGDDSDDGRFRFRIQLGKSVCVIDMPGIPLVRVRCGPDDNPWHFPRLYVDGNSWLWDFAIREAYVALEAPLPGT